MKNTPRADEFKGLYNIDPTLIGATVNVGIDDHLCIREGLGTPSVTEVDKVADLIAEFASEVGGSKAAVSYSVGFNDRSAFVTFRRADLFTLDNLENLRQRLEVQAPDWRIVVCGVSEASTVVVYPSRIVLPQDGDAQHIIEGIRSLLANEHDKTSGVHERQIKYVTHKIREVEIPERPYEPIILAAFDSVMGNSSEYAIWILQSGYAHRGQSWLPDEDIGDGFMGKCGSSEFDVTESRALVGFMEAKDSFIGNINAIAYAKSRCLHEIILVNPQTGKVQRRAIGKRDVLSDHDVKTLLAGSGQW